MTEKSLDGQHNAAVPNTDASSKLIADSLPQNNGPWKQAMTAWDDMAHTSVQPGIFFHINDMVITDLDYAAFGQDAPSQSHNKFIRDVVDVAKALDPSPDVSLRGTLEAHERAILHAQYPFDDKGMRAGLDAEAHFDASQITHAIANQVKDDMGPDKIRQVAEQCADWQDKHDHALFLDFTGPESQPLVREYYNRITQATMDYINQHPIPHS